MDDPIRPLHSTSGPASNPLFSACLPRVLWKHSFIPSVSFSFSLVCISSCLSRRTEFSRRFWRIGPISFILSFSLSLSLSTARDESRGLRVLGIVVRQRIPSPLSRSSEKEEIREISKRKKICLAETYNEKNTDVTASYIHRTVRYQYSSLPSDSVECDRAANEYIRDNNVRRCRYGRRDGGAFSLSIL